MSFLVTWLEKFSNYRDAVRRAGFVFLAVWLHVAIAFYLTMVLFTGHTLNVAKANPDSAKPKHIVEISFTPPVVPPTPPEAPPPPRELPFDPSATSPQQVATPAPPPPPVVPQDTKPDEKAISSSNKDGILDCDSLDKKPERIVIEHANMDLPPQESLSGHLIMKVKIHRNGTVLAVNTESSTMTPRVQDSVIRWVASSLFHPGEMGGVKVDCEMRFEFSLGEPESSNDSGSK